MKSKTKKKNKVEYYYNEDGEIALLVSPGYGAGWSTWNDPEVAYDKRVVEYWLAHKDDKEFMDELSSFPSKDNKTLIEAKEYFTSIGYDGVYFGGFSQIEMVFIPPHIPFRINEYDGYESLVFGYSEFTVLN